MGAGQTAALEVESRTRLCLSGWGLVHGGKGDEGKNKVDYDDGLGCVIAVLMAFW